MLGGLIMKSKIYVSSRDELFLQNLRAFCSRWGAGLVDLNQKEEVLPAGSDAPEDIIRIQSQRGWGQSFKKEDSKVVSMVEVEKQAISDAIMECHGNLTEAARELGIGRATLYRKIKQYDIDVSAHA